MHQDDWCYYKHTYVHPSYINSIKILDCFRMSTKCPQLAIISIFIHRL